MNLAELIRHIAKDNKEVYSLIGTVKSVDSINYTCVVSPLNGEADINVLLNSGDTKTFVQIPMQGANVIVTFLNESTAYLAFCDKIDKLIIASQTESLKSVLTDLITAIEIMTVGTAVGPSTPPINLAQFTAIKTRLNLLLKE